MGVDGGTHMERKTEVESQKKRVEGGDCAGVYRVFTGTARFDVIMASAGRETLEAERNWTYEGDAARCTMRVKRVGGFPVENKGWTQEEKDVTRTLWFARLDDGRHAPVKMRVSWPLGYATGRIDLR